MQKTLTTIFCLLLISLSSFATIIPAGHITTNTTWTKAGSPYIITGEVIFDTNTILTVQPGTVIRFDSTYSIRIDGKLKMQGTATDTIIITSNKTSPQVNDYTGINFYYNYYRTDSSYIDYCRFSFANCAIFCAPSQSVNITNSTFKDCYIGIDVRDANNIIVDNCHFIRYGSGIKIGLNGSAKVMNSSFIEGAETAIWGMDWKSSYCANNTFINNGSGIVRCAYVINNIFTGSRVNAIDHCAFVNNNHIWYNKVGIYYPHVTATHNSIAYNDIGIDYNYHPSFNNGNPPTVKNNCLANNTTYNLSYQGPNLDATDNYWGVTDSTLIAGKLWYNSSYPGGGTITFVPLLSSPDSACDSVILSSNIKTTNQKISLIAYPNPVTSSFTIDAGVQTMQEVFIYNMTGSLVFHSTTRKNKLEINASPFPSGMYMYKVRLDDKTVITGKVLKE
jgi:hypothetical protein